MKTFKLVSLQVVEDTGLLDIPLEDGLIINREDEKNSWLLEAFTSDVHLPFFQSAYDSKQDLIVQVVITKKENDPATFQTKVCSVKKLGQHVSILFEGILKRARNNYAEQLLDHLLQKGLDGSALMQEFKDKMKTRPVLEKTKK
ncbi:YwpF-like family protein [Pseudoneobacillus sp. C159]